MRRFILTLGLCLLGTTSQAEQIIYDLTIRGFKVAELVLNATSDARRYTAFGTINNTGLTRVVRKLSYRGTAQGRLTRNRLIPAAYQEVANTDNFDTTVRMTFRNGVPRIDEYVSERPRTPDAPTPASQKGALDPLSAIFGLLRDIPASDACKYDVQIYDGARQSRLFMVPDDTNTRLPTCKGAYVRQKGYTPEEIERHTQFNLQLSYRDLGNGTLAAENIEFDTIYGTARVIRR